MIRLIFTLTFFIFLPVYSTYSATDAEVSYWKTGLQAYKNNDFDRAIADFTKRIELNPKSEAALLFRGVAFYKTGDYANAIADFKTIERMKKLYVRFADVNLATTYLTLKEYDLAWAYARKPETAYVTNDPMMCFVIDKECEDVQQLMALNTYESLIKALKEKMIKPSNS